MNFRPTPIKDAYLIEPEKKTDERGFFARIWCSDEMGKYGISSLIKQSNISFNPKKGTLRGLHYQKEPFQECKWVRCTQGAIFDVIIDLRKNSPSFMKWFGSELTAENHHMIYVPEGCAHGFITLLDNTEINYLVSEKYTPSAEGLVRWNDPAFKIEWPMMPTVISDKDNNIPDFSDR